MHSLSTDTFTALPTETFFDAECDVYATYIGGLDGQCMKHAWAKEECR
jgi:hypothetical protein